MWPNVGEGHHQCRIQHLHTHTPTRAVCLCLSVGRQPCSAHLWQQIVGDLRHQHIRQWITAQTIEKSERMGESLSLATCVWVWVCCGSD